MSIQDSRNAHLNSIKYIVCPYLQQDATHADYQELGHCILQFTRMALFFYQKLAQFIFYLESQRKSFFLIVGTNKYQRIYISSNDLVCSNDQN